MHSSKNVWVTRLVFCLNDSPIGGSFWQKDSLTTHILFELCPCLFWYLAHTTYLWNTLYFKKTQLRQKLSTVPSTMPGIPIIGSITLVLTWSQYSENDFLYRLFILALPTKTLWTSYLWHKLWNSKSDWQKKLNQNLEKHKSDLIQWNGPHIWNNT